MSADFVGVARLSELARGAVKVVELQGERIAVARVGDSVYAIEDRCSHDDGPLGEGTLRGDQIECPRHGARFDLATGRALCLPAVVGVRSFPVRLEGDSIQVSLGENGATEG